MASRFTLMSFFGRWIFSAALVFGTYNPTQYSYISWLLDKNTEFGPVPALVGIGLLIAWIIFLRATFLSMGWLGIILEGAFFGCLLWLLVDKGWLKLDAAEHMISWLVLLVVSLVLAAGMSWSHIRRRLTGQFDVDDVED
jgi:Family of unknown function (DUF6524)